jgi:UDP-2,3-diacylglucosamine pyrophosphatase LpxH
LGYRGCRAEFLLDFLNATRSEYLFLVGDIVDVWSMRKSFYWPQTHNDVIRRILAKARNGTRVIYVPGNHDEIFRDYAGAVFGKLEIHQQYVHTTLDRRRLLILHGDEFDGVVKCSPWLARLGSFAYECLLHANHFVNRIRRYLGFPYWSLANYLKHRVKDAVDYIAGFEAAVARAARERGVDGVVCGHIHRAGIGQIDGITYCNDGDWVENCTALVETLEGRLELVAWTDVVAARSHASNNGELKTQAA